MTLPVADPGVFADAQSLANLKREAAAHNPQALRAAAQQFESLFIDMMLKSAQTANFKDPLFGSSQQRLYQSLYDQQLSVQMSKTHTFGLAEMLVQQLRRQWPAAAASPQASAPTVSAAAATDRTGQVGLGGMSPVTGVRSAPRQTSGTRPATPAQQTAFARSLWPDAQRAARQLGVTPVALIAQAALETNWGRSMPGSASGAGSNNLFGIKAGASWNGPSVLNNTQEYVNGTPSATQAQFRSYGSCSQCFQDYAGLLSSEPRYAAALGTGDNVAAFAAALQRGGYATDPNYAHKLTAVAATVGRALDAPGAVSPLKLATPKPIDIGSSML